MANRNKEPRNKLLLGPSGAGKSTVIKMLRESGANVLTFDLDFVGFRIDESDFKQWIINEQIFPVLRANSIVTGKPMIAVGACSNWHEVVRAAKKEGFDVDVLCPRLTQLKLNREQRGDSKEKVAEADESYRKWIEIARDNYWRVFDSVRSYVNHVSPQS